MAASDMNKKPDDVCGVCHKKVGSNGVGCEVCHGWWHIKCVGIGGEFFYFLSNCKQLHWFCEHCNSKVGNVISDLARLSGRIDCVEKQQVLSDSKITSIELKLDKMDTSYVSISNKIGDMNDTVLNLKGQQNNFMANIDKTLIKFKSDLEKIETTLSNHEKNFGTLQEREKTFAEIASTKVDEKVDGISEQMTNMKKVLNDAKVFAEDERDREGRTNNVVLYNVPEPTGDDYDARIKCDKHFFLHMMNAIRAGLDEEDISKLVRLGRKSEDPSDRPRPVLITLSSKIAKNLVMANLFRLRYADSKFKNVVISHDMSRKDRDQCKLLSEEAKKLTEGDEKGEWLYRVRGLPGYMTIVPIRKRTLH